MKLIELGKSLGTRAHGRKAKEVLDKKFNEGDGLIVLDFAGVRVITNSFADEFIGKKIREIGLEEFKKRTTFKNIDGINEVTVKRVIINRTIEYDERASKGRAGSA